MGNGGRRFRGAAAAQERRPPPSSVSRIPFSVPGWWTIALTLVSLFACLRPTLRLQHHQLLMLPSLMLLTAMLVRRLEDGLRIERVRWGAAILIAGYAALHASDAIGANARRAEALSRPTSARVVLQQVHAVAPGAHSLLAWGWFPSLYVEGGITPPDREVISQFLDNGLPGEDARRATFLAELSAAPPDVIVDSSERGMEQMFGLSPRMQRFPALAALVPGAEPTSRDRGAGPLEQHILVETRGRVALVGDNRPKVLNALNDALMNELGDALARADADEGIGAIVLTGSDRAFAAR